jgi:hypothetical protein
LEKVSIFFPVTPVKIAPHPPLSPMGERDGVRGQTCQVRSHGIGDGSLERNLFIDMDGEALVFGSF